MPRARGVKSAGIAERRVGDRAGMPAFLSTNWSLSGTAFAGWLCRRGLWRALCLPRRWRRPRRLRACGAGMPGPPGERLPPGYEVSCPYDCRHVLWSFLRDDRGTECTTGWKSAPGMRNRLPAGWAVLLCWVRRRTAARGLAGPLPSLASSRAKLGLGNTDRQIDRLLYELSGLTVWEIGVVEGW